MVTIVGFCCFIILNIYYFLLRRPNGYPPGPRGYPIIGYTNIFFKTHKLTHLAIEHLANKYGPVVGTYFGWKPVVFAYGYEAVKDVLRNKNLDGRQDYFAPTFPKSCFRKGIIFNEGQSWTNQKRYFGRLSREFGFANNSLEGLIQDEISNIISGMTSNNGKSNILSSKYISFHFSATTINYIWHIFTCDCLNHNNPVLVEMIDVFQKAFLTSLDANIGDVFPILYKIAPGLMGIDKYQECYKNIERFFLKTIEAHMKSHDPNHHRGFIDSYLTEIKNNPKYFDEEHLLSLMFELLLASASTLPNFMTVLIHYIIENKHVQRKVQEELDNVIGLDRLPTYEDKSKLPYAMATIRELFRIAPVIPTVAPHRALKDTTLLGYKIPEGTHVRVSVHSVHMDKLYWKDPEVFRPERFIDDDGSLLPENDHSTLSFGAGGRMCVSVPVSKQIIFLAFVTMLQAFEFSHADGHPLPDINEDLVPGITLSLPEYKFMITTRNSK